MHLTLINPPFTFFRKSDIIFSQCLGILYIASYVQALGHKVTVIDSLKEGQTRCELLPDGTLRIGLSNQEIIKKIPAGTDVIGLSGPFSHLAPICHELIGEIKKTFSSVPVVFGGVYPSTQPDICMSSKADYLIIGEGEIPMAELLNYLGNGRSGPVPKGVVPISNSEKPVDVIPNRVENVDLLPPPDRTLIPFEEYITHSQRNFRAGRTASIITSRGCPFDCEFCSIHPVCGYKWRPHSPARVLSEIDILIDEYKVECLEIEDDNFTLNRDRAIEILEGLIERNRGGKRIGWMALNGLRIDTLDDELIKTISHSNCLQLNLALEHGDEDVLKSMNKKLSLAKAMEVVKLTHKYGISCSVFIIYGYPGENMHRFENALSFYLSLKKAAPKTKFVCFIAQPYPGTKLFERAVRQGYILPDILSNPKSMHRFSTSEVIWLETEDFDRAEVLRRRDILFKTLSPELYYRNKLKKILPEPAINYGRYLLHLWKRR